MKESCPALQNALIIHNCVRLARASGDETFVILNRDSPFLTPRARLAINASETNGPLLRIEEGAFKINHDTDDNCTLILESSGPVDLRCVTGVFFKKAGISIPCPPLPQHLPETVIRKTRKENFKRVAAVSEGSSESKAHSEDKNKSKSNILPFRPSW